MLLILENQKKLYDDENEGFDRNYQDKYGNTLLIYSLRKGHFSAISYLLTVEKIDVNVRDGNGYTALDWSICLGYFNITNRLKKIIGNQIRGVFEKEQFFGIPSDLVEIIIDFTV